MSMNTEPSSSAEVAGWGEQWVSEWIAEGPPGNKDCREWVADFWRKEDLSSVMWNWRRYPTDGTDAFDGFVLEWKVRNDIGLYNWTRNGLVVWRMYQRHRDLGLPVPEEILQKFDQWAQSLEIASGAKEIAKAIEMTGDKGGAQGAAQLHRAGRMREIASRVNQLMQLGRRPMATVNEIYREVGKPYRLSAAKVKAIWMRWKRLERQAKAARAAAATQAAIHALVGRQVRAP